MRRSLRVGPCLVAVGVACFTSPGHAQLAPRLSVEQRGDAVLIGNTLAQNCAPDVPAPQVGTVGNCGADDEDSGADVFWSLGTAGQGPPVANVSVTPAEASSAALLALPEGATVTHARLYWSAFAGAGDRTRATLSRVPGESLAVTAPAAVTAEDNGNTFYQASADVTAFVQAGGAGVYRLGGIDAADPVGLDDTSYYAAWWLLVFYSLASEPVRYLGLYDGFERVANGSTSVTLSGFEVAPGAADARLGVVGFEGDGSSEGDQVRVGAAAPLAAADAVGRADNFFDGSRRGTSGAALAVAGDLPETSGAPDSLSGLDLHTVDVASAFAPGQTSAEFLATTEDDRFFLSGLVLSVSVVVPDLTLSSESVRDVDGPPLRPGDELEYTVEVNNSGSGAAPLVTLRAELPAALRYVPGSLELSSGADATPLTDEADADGGELTRGPSELLSVRLGSGDGASGGPIELGETRVVRYRAVVAVGAAGSVVSQAELIASNASGVITSSSRTDSDLASEGVTPTEVVIDGCGADADCSAGAGRCALELRPTRCVACLVDTDCPGLTPACDPTHVCVCLASGSEEALCDGKDDDCDGQIDEGLAGVACEVGVGACQAAGVFVCDEGGEVRCAAEPTALQPELCSNGADDDCDGDVDAADADCAAGVPLSDEGPGVIAPAPAPQSDPVPEPAAEPGAARTPTPGVPVAPPAMPSLDANGEGAGVSLGGGGGGACQLGPSAPSARGVAGLALALALGWVRRRARASARAGR